MSSRVNECEEIYLYCYGGCLVEKNYLTCNKLSISQSRIISIFIQFFVNISKFSEFLLTNEFIS